MPCSPPASTSSAMLGDPPRFPPVRCDRQLGRETTSVDKSTDLLPAAAPSAAAIATAQAVLAARRRAIEARLLTRGSGTTIRGLWSSGLTDRHGRNQVIARRRLEERVHETRAGS